MLTAGGPGRTAREGSRKGGEGTYGERETEQGWTVGENEECIGVRNGRQNRQGGSCLGGAGLRGWPWTTNRKFMSEQQYRFNKRLWTAHLPAS